MKSNPVYKREVTVRARSFRMPLIILVFNGILAVVALLNMYSAVAQVRISASVQYSSFLQLYAFVATLEFLLLMFIMPALTSGSISGERERQTLELLFTTRMTPKDIVMGKLFSALSQLMVLIVSSFPILLLTFVYGSMDLMDLAFLMVCFLVTAVFCGGIGIFSSSLMRRSTFSNVCTYGILLLVVVGTYMLNIFLLNMSQMQIAEEIYQLGETRPAASSGSAVYLLLLNPLATFGEIMEKQVTGGIAELSIHRFLGNGPDNFVIRHWVPVSVLVQTVLSAGLVRGAVYFLNPLKNEKK